MYVEVMTCLKTCPAQVQPQRQRGERSPESVGEVWWTSAAGGSGSSQLQQQGLHDGRRSARNHHRGARPTGRCLCCHCCSSVCNMGSHLPAADVRLGCDLPWDESRVLHSDGRDGEGRQRPESCVQTEERQHAGLLQAQHHLLSSRRPRDVTQVRSADFTSLSIFLTNSLLWLLFLSALQHIRWILNQNKSMFSALTASSGNLQRGARVSEAGSWPQAVFQPLQAGQEAQQADPGCRGAHPGEEVRSSNNAWRPVLDQSNDSWLWCLLWMLKSSLLNWSSDVSLCSYLKK